MEFFFHMKISELYKIFIAHPNITTDTRNIKENSIFIALKGARFNGNQYAEKAIKIGCKYAIIDDKDYQINSKYILVKDSLECLQNLAKYHRKKLTIPIIAITGTNGKTTSKELISCTLASKFKTAATQGNLNNHIGVPLTVLAITKKHEIAIIEMGANHEKEISLLCKIAQPNYGIITNIGKAHLEGFKNLEGIKRAKKELYDYIYNNNGKIFINQDDLILNKISENINSISYGRSGEINGSIKNRFPYLSVLYNDIEITTKLIGNYQFYNVMLAICVAKYFNVGIKDIKLKISKYKPDNNRSQIIETSSNTLILDAYNANPTSMKEMLESFNLMRNKNKICILGDMGELGEFSKKEHLKIVELIKKFKIKTFFIGKEFMNIENVNTYFNIDEFKKYLDKNPIKKSTILIKGSRSMTLERLKAKL